jgi:hypothetical protein
MDLSVLECIPVHGDFEYSNEVLGSIHSDEILGHLENY